MSHWKEEFSRRHFLSGLAILGTTPFWSAADALAWAQTPGQIEYERQQREYRQQQERQRQEQQQQQQLMNENARRQQEESRRLNAPTGQSPTPGYQGATPQTGPRQAGAQANASAATAAAKWEEVGSHTAHGGMDIYSDRVTMRRSGDLVKLWEMWDFKTPQVIGGKRVLSVQITTSTTAKARGGECFPPPGFLDIWARHSSLTPAPNLALGSPLRLIPIRESCGRSPARRNRCLHKNWVQVYFNSTRSPPFRGRRCLTSMLTDDPTHCSEMDAEFLAMLIAIRAAPI